MSPRPASSRPEIDTATCRTIHDALRVSTAYLEAADIPDAGVDARHLVGHALGLDRAALLRAPETPLDDDGRERLAALLARRAAHEPVSRIIGEREFYGLALALGAATLDPRPDTETVVAVAKYLAASVDLPNGEPLKILDLGTGTGAIALALLTEFPGAEVTAIDISSAALAVAAWNAERHGLAGRARFVLSHWLENVTGRYHLVVANPPYIPSGDIRGLEPEVALWDPHAALDGGADGLDAYRTILADIKRVLEPDGWAVFEVGYDQSEQVAELAKERGLTVARSDWPMLRDLGGTVRCVAVTTVGCNRKKGLGIVVQSV
jgi:release factor glutamine methyltransferase